MGYEVLDSRPRRDGPGQPRPASWARPQEDDVVALDPRDGAAPEPVAPPLRRLLLSALTASHGEHRTSLLAGAALAVGALVGGSVGGIVASGVAVRGAARQHAAADDLTQQRVAAVVAYAADVIRYEGAGGRTALLDVRLTNAGPRPVTVVATPVWVDALPGHPVVRPTGVSAVARPGTDLGVLMTVLAHCDDPFAREPTVPVRTLDGTVHDVPIRSGSGALDLTTGCEGRQ